jgi:hypothetical protein
MMTTITPVTFPAREIRRRAREIRRGAALTQADRRYYAGDNGLAARQANTDSRTGAKPAGLAENEKPAPFRAPVYSLT